MSKLTRQSHILELVQAEQLANQEELRKRLVKRGFDVTQATLSRDIHELGLVKTGDGYTVGSGDQQPEPMLPSAMRLVREFVLELPRLALAEQPLAKGDLVQANQRPYGFEFARFDTQQAFFLVLTDDWQRELDSHPVTL